MYIKIAENEYVVLYFVASACFRAQKSVTFFCFCPRVLSGYVIYEDINYSLVWPTRLLFRASLVFPLSLACVFYLPGLFYSQLPEVFDPSDFTDVAYLILHNCPSREGSRWISLSLVVALWGRRPFFAASFITRTQKITTLNSFLIISVYFKKSDVNISHYVILHYLHTYITHTCLPAHNCPWFPMQKKWWI